MKLGIEELLSKHSDLLTGKRLGVLAHPASCNQSGEHTIALLQQNYQITALFGPEHGLDGVAQDMEAVSSAVDETKQLPIYSLYGNNIDSLKPSAAMLDKIDTLIIDLQDVGSRYYTYVWTAVLACQACAEFGKNVIICDRPNPLGGSAVEGANINRGFESFVGLHSIPNRHGMTFAEIVQSVCKKEKLNRTLHICKMQGWSREQSFPETGLGWINPSPNMRSYQAALLYPGMCLLEATNVSEGRGTATPFELCGAPFVRSEELIEHMLGLELPGFSMKSTTFEPTFQKWQHESCHGINWQIENSKTLQPYLLGLGLLWNLHRIYAKRGFAWRAQAYEFVKHIPAIDLLTGSEAFRKRISTRDWQEIVPLAKTPAELLSSRKENLLY